MKVAAGESDVANLRAISRGLPRFGASGKEPACQCRRCKKHGFISWVGKIPWRRAWQPTPVLLRGESHGAWWATAHRVTQSRTRLKRLSTNAGGLYPHMTDKIILALWISHL